MKSLLRLSVFFLLVSSAAAQEQADPAMARMREGMKKLIQRISESDAARVTAEAAKAEADLKVADLEARLKALEKKASDLAIKSTKDKAESDKTIADLNTKLTAKEKEVIALANALSQWKEGFNKAKTVAEGKEAERAAAAGKATLLERRVAAAETKNAEMLKLGQEILARYEKFGLGTALLAREPFVRNMKVKFENYVQDYGDKLDAQRIQPSGASKVESQSSPAAAAPPANNKPQP
jgi:chromosome segregation ATPase